MPDQEQLEPDERPQRICATCGYLQAIPHGYDQCRKLAPRPFVGYTDADCVFAEWPSVHREDWCGEHKYPEELEE